MHIFEKKYFLCNNCSVRKNVGDNCSFVLREILLILGPQCHATHKLGNANVLYNNPVELKRHKTSSSDRVLYLISKFRKMMTSHQYKE